MGNCVSVCAQMCVHVCWCVCVCVLWSRKLNIPFSKGKVSSAHSDISIQWVVVDKKKTTEVIQLVYIAQVGVMLPSNHSSLRASVVCGQLAICQISEHDLQLVWGGGELVIHICCSSLPLILSLSLPPLSPTLPLPLPLP